jgi:hypothetical protein
MTPSHTSGEAPRTPLGGTTSDEIEWEYDLTRTPPLLSSRDLRTDRRYALEGSYIDAIYALEGALDRRDDAMVAVRYIINTAREARPVELRDPDEPDSRSGTPPPDPFAAMVPAGAPRASRMRPGLTIAPVMYGFVADAVLEQLCAEYPGHDLELTAHMPPEGKAGPVTTPLFRLRVNNRYWSGGFNFDTAAGIATMAGIDEALEEVMPHLRRAVDTLSKRR